jgi:basic membrane lipoprotein Med (substrate-binding protein (PBP1-ABC) superfamily)
MARDEAVTFVYNKDKVPVAAQKAVDAAEAKIIAGELKISQTHLQ